MDSGDPGREPAALDHRADRSRVSDNTSTRTVCESLRGQLSPQRSSDRVRRARGPAPAAHLCAGHRQRDHSSDLAGAGSDSRAGHARWPICDRADERASVQFSRGRKRANSIALARLRRRAVAMERRRLPALRAAIRNVAACRRPGAHEDGRTRAVENDSARGSRRRRYGDQNPDHAGRHVVLPRLRAHALRIVHRRGVEVSAVSFADFVLDLDTRELRRGGVPVSLSPKAYELLEVLVVNRPKALSKSALQERLWPRTFVLEKNLVNLIAEIREALDDDAKHPRFVHTARRFGYAFRCVTSKGPIADPNGRIDARFRLAWPGGRAALIGGEYVLGRDPDLELFLDAPDVSRRHAR